MRALRGMLFVYYSCVLLETDNFMGVPILPF
jgi:hypothetical protein